MFRFVKYDDSKTEDNEVLPKFVSFNESNETLGCNCKTFNFAGYPCVHVLAVLIKETLPSSYTPIKERWLIS